MSAKRSLKMDSVKTCNPGEGSPLTKKNHPNSYSPTTGTRQMSPFSSPSSHNAPNLRNGLSHGDETNSGLSRRGQPQTVKDEFAALLSSVESSLVTILKTRENLTSLQALEGSRELESVIGVLDSSCSLSAEVRKTRELMSRAEELQLWEANHRRLPAREPARPPGSTALLQLLLDAPQPHSSGIM